MTDGFALDHGVYYGIAGLHQTIVLGGSYAFDPATLQLDRQVVPAPCPDMRGLATDPVTGDLYVTGDCGLWKISGVGSQHPHATLLVKGDFDGIAVMPGGSPLWVANVDVKGVDEFSFSGTPLAAVPISQGAVGVAAAAGSGVAGDLFVSNDDGSISMVSPRDHDTVSTVADGGYRDDFVLIGPDGYLYVAKADRVVRLQSGAVPVPRAGSPVVQWAAGAVAGLAAILLSVLLTRRRVRRRRRQAEPKALNAADRGPVPVSLPISASAPLPASGDRGCPETADDELRRVLTDPDLLPSGTSLRFAVLVLTIIASTGSVYAHLSVVAQPAADAAASRCLARIPGVITAVNAPASAATTAFGCVDRYAPSLALWSAAGIALVLIGSALAYALTPWSLRRFSRPGIPFYREERTRRWRVRRPWWIPGRPSQRLPELDRQDPLQGRIARHLAALTACIRLEQAPVWLVNFYMDAADARAFGHRRRTFVVLNFGLLMQFSTDLPGFDATLLHELAHLRNRDNRPTYGTLAAWRVFVVVVLVPYFVSLVAPRIIRDPFSAGAYRLAAAPPDPRITTALLSLAVLVFLASRAVIRAREAHADCTAALHDGGALRKAIARASEAQSSSGRADFTRYHPGPRRRLRDLDNPALLIPPGALTMFTVGVAVSLIMVNTGFSVSLGALDSWLSPGTIAAVERALAAGSRGPIVAFQLMLDGLPTVLALATLVAFGCTIAWRAYVAAQASSGTTGGRRRGVLRDALPLVAGMMIGEPLSAIYADAGTWGVFDTSVPRDLADIAASAVALVVLVVVIFVWARESAAVWIPAARRSLRVLCTVTVIVGTVGAAPAMFTWVIAHNTANITGFGYPQAPAVISTWFGARWAYIDYYPLTYLTALPGAGLLFAVPCLYLALGAVRHRRLSRSSRQLTPSLRTAMTLGLTAAVICELACFAVALAAHDILGATATRVAFDTGTDAPYLPIAWMSWTAVTVCALTVVIVIRVTRAYNLTTVLLTSFITAGAAAFLLLPSVFVSLCGSAAYSCATQEPHDFLAAYGLLASFTTVDAAIVTVLVLAVLVLAGRVIGPLAAAGGPAVDRVADQDQGPARRSTGTQGRKQRAVAWLAALLVLANALAGVYVFYTSVFAW